MVLLVPESIISGIFDLVLKGKIDNGAPTKHGQFSLIDEANFKKKSQTNLQYNPINVNLAIKGPSLD